jgi:hypothetical protein
MKKNNNFKFWVPLEFSKAKNETTGEVEMKIGGIASTSAKDSDDEELDPAGFDLSVLKSHGVINWHHMQKTNPDAIIGEPTKAELTPKGLYLEAKLYPDSELAKKVYKLAEVLAKNSKTRRLGFSIEGKKTEVDPNDETKILKAKITGCAITYLPKNPTTFADIIKGHEVEEPIYEFDEEIEKSDLSIKALNNAANGGAVKFLVNLTTKDGKTVKVTEDGEITVDMSKSLTTEAGSGGALKKEHVDSGLKETIKTSDKPKELTKAEAFDKIFSDFPDIDIQKAKQIFNTTTKITAMSKEKTKPTKDEIEKAYAVLGLNNESEDDNIEKGENTTESEDEVKPPAKKPAAPAKTATVEKGGGDKGPDEEEEEEEEEDEEPAKPAKKDMNKAQSSDLMYFQKGDNYVAMVNKGGELQEVPDKLFQKTASGYQEIIKTPIEKSIEENIGKLLNGQSDLQKAIGVVVGDLKAQVSGLQKQVEEMSGQPTGRKSATNATVKEKKFAGANDDLTKGRTDGKTLSIKNRNAVLSVLEKAMYLPLEKGQGGLDAGFEKAMTTFEASGQISAQNVGRLEREFGIFLVD